MSGVETRRVRDTMTTRVATVREGDPLGKVAAAFEAHSFHHVPVLDASGSEVVGIVSDRDLLRASLAGRYDPTAPVSSIMSRQLASIHANANLALAAARLVEANVNSLLVRDADGQFLGVLTSWDLIVSLATEAELSPDGEG